MFPTLPTLSTLPAALSQPFKRATLGLFHGKTIQYGNNVPHSLNKTRRTWLPNVHTKTFDSPLLARRVQVKVTARALRTIHKHGGLDQYLLNTSPSLLGDEGMRLRLLVRERFDEQNALEARRAQRAAEVAAKEATRREAAEKRAQTQREAKAKRRSSEADGGLVRGLFAASS
ncbi:Ribosomal L28 family domain containing protein [Tylopilus felleus]